MDYRTKVDCKLPECIKKDCKIFTGLAEQAYTGKLDSHRNVEIEPRFGKNRNNIQAHQSEVGKVSIIEYTSPKDGSEPCIYGLDVSGPGESKVFEKMMKELDKCRGGKHIVIE